MAELVLDDEKLEQLQRAAFEYFLQYTNPKNGLVADTSDSGSHCSIAAIGFALTSYPVAVKNGWIERGEAVSRVLTTLRFLRDQPQSRARHAIGYRGFFYHFLHMESGHRAWNSELSLIDTAILLMGVLATGAFFEGEADEEAEIRSAATQLYERADWNWALNGGETLAMGWKPGSGFLRWRWQGYDEALMLYLLALGSPTHPVKADSFDAFASTYNWTLVQDKPFLYAGPLFIHLFSHAWINFRGIRDRFMAEKDSDYARNTQLAIHVQRNYADRNPNGFKAYSQNIWGFTACDGPLSAGQRHGKHGARFIGYAARGAPFGPDDGTIAPWAPLSCIAFDRQAALDGTAAILQTFPDVLREGRFIGAFNPSAEGSSPTGWSDNRSIGIDQGLLVLMMENARSGLIWQLMGRSPPILKGLQKAGFTGGWLDDLPPA